jgi:hypothetical protein
MTVKEIADAVLADRITVETARTELQRRIDAGHTVDDAEGGPDALPTT